MARFMSSKFLKYSQLSRDGGTIDEDLECPKCGYNLRGLARGRACPECGGDTVDAHLRPLVDVFGSGEVETRRRFATGLFIIGACLIVAVLARMTHFVGAVAGGLDAEIYRWIGACNAVLWIIGAYLVVPARLDEHWSWMKPLRWTVMLTQPLWIAAYAVMLYQLDVMNTAGIASTGYTVAHLALRFLAGLGVVVLAFILHFLATECEEDDAARRLNSVVWLLIPLSLLPQMLAGSIPWFAMAIQLIFVGAWVWIMWLFILGVVRLQRHAAWSLKDTVSEHGREERIAEKRAEFDREVEARIRAAPQTDDDPISY